MSSVVLEVKWELTFVPKPKPKRVKRQDNDDDEEHDGDNEGEEKQDKGRTKQRFDGRRRASKKHSGVLNSNLNLL